MSPSICGNWTGEIANTESIFCPSGFSILNPELLRSQFADLEEPKPDEDVITVELGRTPEEIVEEIKTKLHLVSND